MTWKYTEEYYKNYTRETWDESADVYDRLIAWQFAPFSDPLIEALKPRGGEHVLDVATGPGEPAMTIARAIEPDGRVTGIDLSQRMVDIAEKTARLRGLSNAAFRAEDAENLSFADASFDVVISRFGFQIITDPDAAAREALRVLRPGGRIGLTVWPSGKRAPALDVFIGPMLAHAEPDETGYLPTPYELGGKDELAALLREKGFVDTREWFVSGGFSAPSVQEYMDMIVNGTPIGHSLSEETEDVRRTILDTARSTITRYQQDDGGVRIPAECLVVTARKPE